MTAKKTLKLRDPSEQADAPVLKRKGRGWEISEKRLDVLHERARDMRRHSSEAHKALAARFAKADLGRYKFTRHAVIGSAIVLTVQDGPIFLGVPVLPALGLLGYVLAVLNSLWIVYGIWRSGRE